MSQNNHHPSDADAQARDEDDESAMRTDIGEWQEGPSSEANPAEPEPVAERMSAAEDSSSDQPGEAGTGAARTPEGEVVRETDFYPSGLPGPKNDQE